MTHFDIVNQIKKLCNEYGISGDAIQKQLNSKRVQLNGQVTTNQVKRSHSIPDEPTYLRIFVSKHKSHIGDELSPFNLLIDANYLPYSDLGKVPLELWWQSAKISQSETNDFFLKRRRSIYQKGEPKRRYFDLKKGVKGTLFGIPPDHDVIYDYLESRYFYCQMYQYYASQTASYLFLDAVHQLGVNLLLMGPDGYPLSDNIYQDYLNTTVPFGHERILVCMLLGLKPWEKYRLDNSDVFYPDWIIQLGSGDKSDSKTETETKTETKPETETEIKSNDLVILQQLSRLGINGLSLMLDLTQKGNPKRKEKIQIMRSILTDQIAPTTQDRVRYIKITLKRDLHLIQQLGEIGLTNLELALNKNQITNPTRLKIVEKIKQILTDDIAPTNQDRCYYIKQSIHFLKCIMIDVNVQSI